MFGLKALYQNVRIKYKLLALISVVMAIVGVLIVSVQQMAFEVYDGEIYQQSAKALNLTSSSIEGELKKMEQLSFRIATDSSIQLYLTQIKHGGSKYSQYVLANNIRTRMVNLGGLDKYVLSVQMFDYYNYEYSIGVNQISTPRARVQLIERETEKTQGGNTWIHPDAADAALGAARKIRSFEMLNLEPLGMVNVRINMEQMLEDFAKGIANRAAEFIILDGDSVVFPGKTRFPAAELRSELTSKQGGYTIVADGGKSYFISYVSSDNTSWTYVNVIPYDGIFQNIVYVKRTVLLVYCLLFVIAIMLTFRMSKGITDPIERLNAKMRKVRLDKFEWLEESGDMPLSMDEAGQLHRNFRMMVARINDLIQENYVKQLAMKESEFRALQAQINPHFLYNTLETINWSAKINRQPHISQMVESLGYLLRSSINLKEPIIPLRHELEIVRNYIVIQQIRFEERLDFAADVAEELLDCQVPKLSLQPLVENAVNYGLELMTETCRIRIAAVQAEGKVVITVGDNGPGMDGDVLARLQAGELQPKGSGVGLRNIDERIKLLFGDTFGLVIDSARGDGTRVSLHIPLERRGQHV